MKIRRALPVLVKSAKGQKPNVIIVCYNPGFKCAYGMFTQEDGDSGPVMLSIFGDDLLNQRRLRSAWRIFGNVPSRKEPDEWSMKWVVAEFVGWLNSGGEERAYSARRPRS